MPLQVLVLSLLLSAVIFSSNAIANSGEQIYQQCAACHGANAEGNAQLKSPRLAGQFDWYLTRQLENFSKGLRGAHKDDALGMQMTAMSQALNYENDVPALTAYLSKLESPKLADEVSGDLKNGSRYYQGKCGACHGGVGEGNKSFNAPKLAGLSSEYLKRQMDNFVSGIRGSHADDKLGKQMSMMAKIVSEKELNDILFFLSQQPANSNK